MLGGGTQPLAANHSTWNAPGGETVYLDQQQGDLIVFTLSSCQAAQPACTANP
jgi:hypothetical protein